MEVHHKVLVGEAFFPTAFSVGSNVVITYLLSLRTFPMRAYLTLCNIVEKSERLKVEFDCRSVVVDANLYVVQIILCGAMNDIEVAATANLFRNVLYSYGKISVNCHECGTVQETADRIEERTRAIIAVADRNVVSNEAYAWSIAARAYLNHENPRAVAMSVIHNKGLSAGDDFGRFMFRIIVPRAQKMVDKWSARTPPLVHSLPTLELM